MQILLFNAVYILTVLMLTIFISTTYMMKYQNINWVQNPEDIAKIN